MMENLQILLLLMPVFSSGMDRLYGSPNELSTKESIVDPVDFINDHEHGKQIFIGRNNTEIWAHAGSNVVFDCLVGRPNLENHGPIMWSRNSPFTLISIGGIRHLKIQDFGLRNQTSIKPANNHGTGA